MKKLSFKLGEVNETFHPFVKHLLSMSDRISLHKGLNNHSENSKLPKKLADNDQGMFFVSKQAIHIPYYFPNINHEIAHIVEMNNPKRWILPDLGMSLGPNKTEAGNFAITSREVRVRAIQLHFIPSMKLRDAENSSTYNIFSNSIYSSWFENTKGIGKLKTFNEIKEYFYNLRDRTFYNWSLDKIEHEWKKRIDYIHNWQDSSSFN